MQVEAMPDADGLKVAIVTGVVRETQELVYQLFKCKNETEFGLTSIQGDNLKTFGGEDPLSPSCPALSLKLPFPSDL